MGGGGGREREKEKVSEKRQEWRLIKRLNEGRHIMEKQKKLNVLRKESL